MFLSNFVPGNTHLVSCGCHFSNGGLGLAKGERREAVYERPGCVTAYAILLGIAAVVSCMAGFFLLANSRDGIQGLSSIVSAAVIAALYFVIARGLWLLRNWARIVVIVLQVLSVLGILSQLPNNSSGLVLIVAVFGLAIAAYILYWFASHGEYFE